MHSKRYASLDAWRGAAALGVFLYHRFLTRMPQVGAFWMAVQLFFVISGYCIAAAADGAIRREMGFGAFMRRRLRRIAPPYIASCFLAIGFRVLWNGRSQILTDWGMYLQNLFMMQWVSLAQAQFGGGPVPHSAFDNPRLLIGAYWSLNYEEQFYLVAAALVMLAIVFGARAAAALLVVVTGAVAVLNVARPGLVTGLFCDYWLQFTCGVAVYIRLCKLPSARAARWFDLGLTAALAACAIAAYRNHELSFDPHTFHFFGQLCVCAAFACLLVVLRPFDDRLIKTWPGRIFGALGKFSYSLYLIHIPVVGALHFIEKKITPRIGTLGADAFVCTVVLVSSWLFYRLFERPFQNQPLADPAPRTADEARAPECDRARDLLAS